MTTASAEARECESAKVEAIRTAAVIGLGMMGGSLARDLAARGVRVLGWDRDGEAVRAAIRDGAVAAALAPGFAAAAEVDVVAIAVPVLAAPALLAEMAPHLSSVPLVTDLGSTKRTVVEAAERAGIGARFVGAHPLAGKHLSGWEASEGEIFRDAAVYLCATGETGEEARALAHRLWTSLGARPVEIDAEEHDERLAWSSHLPQALSTALARALAGRGVRHGELGPGGQGMARLAGSSPEMWTDVALDNAPALFDALFALEEEIAGFRLAVAARDVESVRRFFRGGRQWWDAVGEG
ncbi:MAG TPA: prephenate dehydrogenase [Longimicrobium sp.]|nr:prephenate dehydrogenase [Longimicrobium sp.]